MFTAAELTAMRTELQGAMPDQATIERPAASSDNAGGRAAGAPGNFGPFACRVSPVGPGGESEVADRVTAESSWVIAFPFNTDVKVSDRVLVGTRTFEVVGVNAPRTYELERRAHCREIL